MTVESRPGIEVKKLSKTYPLADFGEGPVSFWRALRLGPQGLGVREVKALDDVSFSVGQGERVGIIGRNGAGKTTLLSILAGTSVASSGEVDIKGHVHAMLTIGAVLRDDATGRENIRLDGSIHGRTPAEVEESIEDIIAFSELGDFIDRPVRTYSSGMKARLAFSMSSLIQPDVLIVDETLSVGDAFFEKKASKRLAALTATGCIVILVSHSLKSIVAMCNRCLWMENGRVVMDGAPEEVTRAYQEAVQQADDTALAAKFEKDEAASIREHCKGRIVSLDIEAAGGASTIPAFVALTLECKVEITQDLTSDLELSVLRVDGREIFRERASVSDLVQRRGPGTFRVKIKLDPQILGAGLYRFKMRLLDGHNVLDIKTRVLEVIDEEGQYGGVPMFYLSPSVTVSRNGDAK